MDRASIELNCGTPAGVGELLSAGGSQPRTQTAVTLPTFERSHCQMNVPLPWRIWRLTFSQASTHLQVVFEALDVNIILKGM